MGRIDNFFQILSGKLSYIINRMAKSPGKELEQLLIRFISSFLITTIIYTSYSEVKYATELLIGYSIVIPFVIFFSFYWVYKKPERCPTRYILNSIFDVATLTAGSYLGGELGIAIYPFFLWAIFGNGFRYGVKFLYISMVITVIGLTLLAFTSPFMIQYPIFITGLILGAIFLPLYVGKLLSRLQIAVSTSEDANKAKSTFLANMSHELRTPLNGILGANDLIQNTPLNKEQQEYSNTIGYSIRALLEIIEKILDISKIEAGKLRTNTVKFDLHHLLKNIVKMLEHKAHEKGLNFTMIINPDVPYALNGDVNHLRQILMNLVGNAIKFTDEGKVQIIVSQLFVKNNYSIIRFQIVDTGCGLTELEQKTVFDRFTQADESSTRRYGGAGLGTTIAKQLTEKSGGTIGLDSVSGEGSTFWVEIPFLQQSVNWEQNNDLSKARVLIVSDTNDILLTVIDNCHTWGVELIDTNSAKDALKIIDKAVDDNKPIHAVIISKSNLDVNAIHFAKALRAKLIFKHMALILFNRDVSDNIQRQLLDSGFTCILDFPIDMPLLFNAIHSAPLLETQTADNIESIAAYYSHSKHPKKYRILLAEDNESNQLITKRILEYGGHTVVTVDNGEEALDMFEEELFDLCITDMHMPVMGGIQLVQLYNFMYPDTPMPFIMLTANATIESIYECKQAGIDIYLTKPIKSSKLLSTISSLTTLPRATRQSTETKKSSEIKLPKLYPVDTEVTELLNLETLKDLEILNTDGEFIDNLIKSFQNDGKKILLKLDLALIDKHSDFINLCHAFKGNAGAVGATSLFQLCHKYHSLTKQEYKSNSKQYLNNIRKSFKTTQYALLRYSHELSQANTTTT
ncbi:MAG: ATP-binding protein [Gammaproteobacteria bacterium]